MTNVAAGDFYRPHFQRFLIDTDMNFTPNTAFGAAMLACIPRAFTFGLDPRAIDGQVKWPCGAAIRQAPFSVFWRRHKVLKSGVAQSNPTSRSKLWTNPVVWRNGMPNRTFSVKQV
jgi:hypothetical protein